MGDLFGVISIQPRQAVEFDDEQYFANLRFIATQWNRKLYQTGTPNAATNTSDDARFVTSYLQNALYVFGRQEISDYAFFVEDAKGQTTKFPMFRGMDINKILLHIDGVVRQSLDNLPKTISATAFSKGAVAAKKEILDFIRLKAEHKVFFELIQMQTGIEFKPINRDFKTQEELDKYIIDFQEGMEIAYQRIAKHILITNRYLPLITKVAKYIAVGGVGAVEVYEHGGMIKWRIIPPEGIIVDMSKSDDQHEEDDYAGCIRSMSVPDLIDMYEWTEKEIEELQTMAKSSSMWGQYNTYTGLNGLYWWAENNGVPKIMVVKGQWRSLEKMDGKWVEVLREGDLIGNKFLRNCKISEGQVWNKLDKTRKRLKYRIVTPNSILGSNISIVGMLKRYQDLKDAFATKMMEMSSRAIGKSYVINANKLPEGLTTPDIISQLKQSNIVVLEGADIDEINKRQSLVETIDLTLDPNVRYYLDMIQYYDNYINDIINIPAQSRGFQANYQSANQIQTNINQSTLGMQWYYGNIMTWVKNLLEYSADFAKLVLPENEDSDFSLVVGDAMVEIMKIDEVKKMQFEDFLLDLNPRDLLSVQDKAEITQIALQTASSGGSVRTLKNFIALKRSDSLTEAYDYLEIEIAKEEERERIAIEQQQQLALQQAQMNNQTQENIANSQNLTGLAKQEMANEAKMQPQQQMMQEEPPMQ